MNTPATKAVTLHCLPLELFEESAQLEAECKKVVKSAGIDPKKLDMAVNLIAMARAMSTQIDTLAKEETKRIMQPVSDLLDTLKADRSTLSTRATKIASAIESGLQGLIASGHLTPEGYRSKVGTTLSLVKRDDMEIMDASAIPDEYLLPREQCIDRAKVAAALKIEREAAEAGVQLTSKIPGARLVRSYTFRTKLPEEVA